jgi:hypothetical protein
MSTQANSQTQVIGAMISWHFLPYSLLCCNCGPPAVVTTRRSSNGHQLNGPPPTHISSCTTVIARFGSRATRPLHAPAPAGSSRQQPAHRLARTQHRRSPPPHTHKLLHHYDSKIWQSCTHLCKLILPDSNLHIVGSVRSTTDAQRARHHSLSFRVLPAAPQQLNLQLQHCQQLRTGAPKQRLLQGQNSELCVTSWL